MSGVKVCNIYDMASNCYECTTEYCVFNGTPCNLRGGSYVNEVGYVAFRRRKATTDAGSMDGFRCGLYIK